MRVRSSGAIASLSTLNSRLSTKRQTAFFNRKCEAWPVVYKRYACWVRNAISKKSINLICRSGSISSANRLHSCHCMCCIPMQIRVLPLSIQLLSKSIQRCIRGHQIYRVHIAYHRSRTWCSICTLHTFHYQFMISFLIQNLIRIIGLNLLSNFSTSDHLNLHQYQYLGQINSVLFNYTSSSTFSTLLRSISSNAPFLDPKFQL